MEAGWGEWLRRLRGLRGAVAFSPAREEIHRPSNAGGSRFNHTPLWGGANHPLQPLQRLTSLKLNVIHAQPKKNLRICAKSILLLGITLGDMVAESGP